MLGRRILPVCTNGAKEWADVPVKKNRVIHRKVVAMIDGKKIMMC